MDTPNLEQMIPQGQDPNAMPAPANVTAPTGPEMATPEQVQQLHDLMGTVKNAQASLVTKKLIKKNEVTSLQRQLMDGMFGIMQQAGADPSNPESIRAFLAQMEQKHPDLLELFITAFQNLSGGPLQGMAGETPPPNPMAGGGEPSGSLMDQFRNLPEAMPPQ